MIRRSFIVGSILAVLGVMLVVANFFIYGEIRKDLASSPIELTLPAGTSLRQISHTLEEKGVVSNALIFEAYIHFRRSTSKVRAGDYVFTTPISPREVLSLLMKGDFSKKSVTFPEGWTIVQVATQLANMKLAKKDEFLARCSDPALIRELKIESTSLEGYLFPNTYQFYQQTSADDIIRSFVKEFWKNWTPEMEARRKELGMSLNEVVTLASIIEKETGKAVERTIVSSVFHNRLKINMPLATDPSVIYGIPNFNGNITRADLARPSPYNTYLNKGLPPTPIANPGFEAIKAALYPASTQYLFFVSRNDGTHEFTTNERDHFNAVNRYQRGR